MPTCEYRCPHCLREFEVDRKITDDAPVACPRCSTAAERLISWTHFTLRGGGWGRLGQGRLRAATEGKEIMSTREVWLQTYSGGRFHPLNPVVDEVRIEDIAHALSLLNRFAGHTKVPYNVADHSLRVMDHCSPRYKLLGLLHDAAEAYVIDLPSPIKNDSSMSNYRLMEARVQAVIFKACGVEAPSHAANGMPPDVAYVDARMLATEVRDLMSPPPEPWFWLPEPYPGTIRPLDHAQAEAAFLDAFTHYGGQILGDFGSAGAPQPQFDLPSEDAGKRSGDV